MILEDVPDIAAQDGVTDIRWPVEETTEAERDRICATLGYDKMLTAVSMVFGSYQLVRWHISK
jgi:hypothetical protein